jgi:hypothetical protein
VCEHGERFGFAVLVFQFGKIFLAGLVMAQEEYRRFRKRPAIEWAREHGGGSIAHFLQALLGYLDQPWNGETLTVMTLDQSGNKQRSVVAAVPGLDPTQRTPKEEALLALLIRERARGHKVLVFVIHTELRAL